LLLRFQTRQVIDENASSEFPLVTRVPTRFLRGRARPPPRPAGGRWWQSSLLSQDFPPYGPTSVKPVTSIVVTNRPSERWGKGGVWKVNGALAFGATSAANVNGSVLPGLSVPG
jgi:hypothetical protein